MTIENPLAVEAEQKFQAHDFEADAQWKEIENNLDFSAVIVDKHTALLKRKRKYFQKNFVQLTARLTIPYSL
jgi:hypothetical protein